MSMPRIEKEEDQSTSGQRRQPMQRYRLQVDRQTKRSFASFEDAEKAGKAIKEAHPIVQVAIYDADESQVKIIT
jgi:hypothetical protein